MDAVEPEGVELTEKETCTSGPAQSPDDILVAFQSDAWGNWVRWQLVAVSSCADLHGDMSSRDADLRSGSICTTLGRSRESSFR